MYSYLLLSVALVSAALAAPCADNGTLHPWGYVHSPNPSKPCYQLICFNDWILHNGCQTEAGGCVPYGSTRVKGCWEERCQPGLNYRTEHAYEWVAQRPAGCEVTPEFCYPPGYIRRVNCTVRKCDRHNGDSSYNLDIIDFGCPLGNRCLAVGEEVISGCQQFKCLQTAPFTAELRVGKLPLEHTRRRKCRRQHASARMTSQTTEGGNSI